MKVEVRRNFDSGRRGIRNTSILSPGILIFRISIWTQGVKYREYTYGQTSVSE